MNATLSDPDRIISPSQFCQLVGISETTRWRQQRNGEGPKAIRLSPRRIGYRASDVASWLQARHTEAGAEG